MKVCMLLAGDCHSDPRVDREARALFARGHQVLVLARRGRALPDVEDREGYQIRRIPIGPRQPGAALTRGQRLALNMRTIAAAVALRTDVIHAHELRTMGIGCVAAAKLRVPLVYDSHELHTELENTGARSMVRRFLFSAFERMVIRRATEVITVNNYIADELARRYGIARPAVVMNCVELPEESVQPVDLRRLLGLPRGVRVVVYQGGMAPYRALDKLVLCARLLDNCVLVFIGDGPMLPPLQRLAAEQNLQDRVRFLGRVPMHELLSYTLGADVGVAAFENTSLNNYYASPNKLFEYIAAGIPVAASHFPFVTDVVVGCDVGAVFDPQRVESMARAINRLVSSHARLAQLRRNARRAAERYNWRVESQKLLDVYQRISAS